MALSRKKNSMPGRLSILVVLATMCLLLLLPIVVDAASPQAAVEQKVQQAGTWYVVKTGDTLFSIANRFGTTVSAIMRANGLTSTNIYVGQRLWVPGSELPPPTAGGIWYVVKPGDTLYSIAKRYGTTVSAIMRTNHIATPNRIYVGQVLWIPISQPMPPVQCSNWYSVQAGDTLFSIAQRYGVTVEALMLANRMTSTQIVVGQLLCIPGGGMPVTVTPGTPVPTTTPGPTPTATPQGSWSAQYFNNRDLAAPVVFSQTSTTLNFDWGDGSPNPAVNIDNFSARYEGTFHFSTGIYRFLLTVDDGGRLFIDDNLVINAWREQSKTGYFADINVTGGSRRLKVEYFEATARASVSLTWQLLGQPR